MKNSIIIFFFFLSSFSFGQVINQETLFQKNYNFLEEHTNNIVYSLNDSSVQMLELYSNSNMNKGYFEINLISERYSYKKNIFFNFPHYKLTEELKSVMLEIPGLDKPIDYNPKCD
jgi:hypothetical protein